MTPELQPSKLGTKEYWDKVHREEVENFDEQGDEGEVWFGMESVEKMVDWMSENVPASSLPFVLEVGCGNGILLFSLLEAGYNPDSLAGIDYSADAIELTKRIAATRQGGSGISFNVCDFLLDSPRLLRGMDSPLWDVLLDKGTFDAIALGVKDESGKSPALRYPPRVANFLKPGGFLLITSCNFTEDELKLYFEVEEYGLRYHSRIPYPTFSFGGRSGSICSTVAFQKSE